MKYLQNAACGTLLPFTAGVPAEIFLALRTAWGPLDKTISRRALITRRVMVGLLSFGSSL